MDSDDFIDLLLKIFMAVIIIAAIILIIWGIIQNQQNQVQNNYWIREWWK